MEPVLLYMCANSFGLLRVLYDSARNVRVLMHGQTRHGMQSVDPARSDEPLAYYHRGGPLGDIFSGWTPRMRHGRVGIVGLGTGAIAAYAEPGQRFTFYEIDPAVARVASDPQYFTYLSRCRGTHDIVLGDGRESLEKADGSSLDMIILDAFQDAVIPTHLVSIDAVRLYLQKMSHDGLLIFHINTHGALQPELKRLACEEGLICLFRADVNLSDSDEASGKLQSYYLVLARDRSCVSWLAEHPKWTVSQGVGYLGRSEQ